MTQLSLQKVVFLDRDGVINRDSRHYVKSWDEFEFIPGSLSAIRRLHTHGHPVIIITNQSGVNRGLIPLDVLNDIHTRLKQKVRQNGGEITDIFFCPHRPAENCTCRKPQPGLIYQAKKRYRLDCTAATMVGDSAKDIECAEKAGCRHRILVKSGLHDNVQQELAGRHIFPDLIAGNLLEATDWIIKHYGQTEKTE